MKCTRCKNEAVEHRLLCTICAENGKTRSRKVRESHKNKNLCISCGKPPIFKGSRCKDCYEYNSECSKQARAKLKDEVFAAYGGYRCKCCNELKHRHFMQIDHVDGGGRQHKKELGGSSRFYRWLKANNFPPGFQPLCADCNFAKGLYGKCPHEDEEEILKTLAEIGLIY